MSDIKPKDTCKHGIPVTAPCTSCRVERFQNRRRVDYSGCVHGIAFGQRCDNCLSLTLGISLHDAKQLKPGPDGRFEFVHKPMPPTMEQAVRSMFEQGRRNADLHFAKREIARLETDVLNGIRANEALGNQRDELFTANTRQMKRIEQLEATVQEFETVLQQKNSMFDALIEQGKSLLRTTDREDATITAALQLWKEDGSECQFDEEYSHLWQLACGDGDFEPLTEPEIDVLIMRLNR